MDISTIQIFGAVVAGLMTSFALGFVMGKKVQKLQDKVVYIKKMPNEIWLAASEGKAHSTDGCSYLKASHRLKKLSACSLCRDFVG